MSTIIVTGVFFYLGSLSKFIDYDNRRESAGWPSKEHFIGTEVNSDGLGENSFWRWPVTIRESLPKTLLTCINIIEFRITPHGPFLIHFHSSYSFLMQQRCYDYPTSLLASLGPGATLYPLLCSMIFTWFQEACSLSDKWRFIITTSNDT